MLCFFIFETFCPSFLYTNCKGSNDLRMEMSDPFSVPESLRYWGAAIQGLVNGGEIPRKILTGDYSEQENTQDKERFKNQRNRSFQQNKRGNLQIGRRGQFRAKRSNKNRQRREHKKITSRKINRHGKNQRGNKLHNFERKVSTQSQKAKNKRRRYGREGSPEILKRNSRSDCRRPNAESLVRQMYKKCEEAGVCMDDNGQKIWESVNEIFARFSYVSPQLRKYITTKEFRRSYMYDGKTLTANTNERRLIGPSYKQESYYYPYGLSNTDGKFPDFLAREENICPKVPHTFFNCYGECRSDNCNENPPKKGTIIIDDLIPSILSIPLHKFITADLKDFSDPFEGQLGYVLDDKGRVKNVDGTFTFYRNNSRIIRSELARVSTWNGKNIWDGVGRCSIEVLQRR